MRPYYHDEAAGITLYHGDNAAVLPTLPAGSVDLVVTSPPYNLGNTTGGRSTVERKSTIMQHGRRAMGHYSVEAGVGARGGNGKWQHPALKTGYGDEHDDDMPHEEYVAWQQGVLCLLWPLLSDTGAIFYNHKPRVLAGLLVPPMDYVPDCLRPYVRQEIVWRRSGGVNFSTAFYMPTHERIVVIARPDFRLRDKAASGVGDVWEIVQETRNPHPAPFPLSLPKRAIETTPAGLVLDPFCGSGTTLVAAKLLGRKAIGIELSERYCQDAALRLERTQPVGSMAVPLFGVLPGLAG